MTVTADALDLLAGDPPRTRQPGDFQRHPTTGAPYVNHPTTGKRVMYGRPSSFGAALDNPFNLVKWKERQLLIGASMLPDDLQFLDLADRDQLDKLAARCHDAAGSHLAADQGTHVHLLCERWDRNQPILDLFDEGERLGISSALQMRIVDQWDKFRRRLGLTALAVEQTVVNDRWRLAGTLDRLDVADRDHLTAYGILEAGVPFVGDIKTGGLTLGNDGQPNYWVKYPVQLAAYVDAVPYDTETDTRCVNRIGPVNRHIALIYHYDLAGALAGEVVDWQAIPVNVDAGREGGDLCRAAADFSKRRDLFAIPAPTYHGVNVPPIGTSTKIPAPVIPATVEQEVADPEPATASSVVPGSAANHVDDARRIRLRARIIDLVDSYSEADRWLRHHWPEGVPTLKYDGHTDEQLDLILAAVRRVEAEVGAGWHPDDGGNSFVASPPVGVEASTTGPAATHDEGGPVTLSAAERLRAEYDALPAEAAMLCKQIASEAQAAGRSVSLQAVPTLRRWSIARAVIAWAASGKTVDEMWCHAALLATFEQCADADATLGGLISQFSMEQATRLYDAAGQ